MGIIPTEGECRKCKTLISKVTQDGNKRYWMCRQGECETKTYIRSGTVLENSNLRFDRFVNLAYSFSAQNMTYKENKKEARLPPGHYADNGLSDKTVNKWNQYFRWLCAQDIKKKHKKVGGRSMIVEMDESLFGKLKFGKGSAAQRRRKWVFGGKCRETGRVFLALCPKNKRTKKSLWPIILKNVKIGSVLHTDGWKAYRKLPSLGYRHRWVDHSKYYVHPDDPSLHTNGIEGKWGEIKRWLPQGGRYNLEQYLNLYNWFEDQKVERKDPFWSLIALIVAHNTTDDLRRSQEVVPDTEGHEHEDGEEEVGDENDNQMDTSDSETDDDEEDMVFSCPWCLRYYETREEVADHLPVCDQK